MNSQRGTRRYTWESLRAGQPRPYADSEYEGILTVEWIKDDGGEFVPNPEFNTYDVKKIGCMLIGGAIDADKAVSGFEMILGSMTSLGDGKYRFTATQAYTG